MTLANFKSNFNWQYRMLKEAAECCGIVPDLPPAPPPPVADCYWYTKVHDNTCSFFNPVSATWTLNGVDVFSGWQSIMQNPPYGTVGNAIQYGDPLSGCGSGNLSDFYLWTVVPSTVPVLPILTGNDSNGNLVNYPMLGPICGRKCYEGSFRSSFGSTIVWGFNTAEVNAPGNYSLFVDLTDPGVDSAFAAQLGQYYPSPPLSVTVTVLGPDEYNIRIDGVYSLGGAIYIYMDDNVTVAELLEVPC